MASGEENIELDAQSLKGIVAQGVQQHENDKVAMEAATMKIKRDAVEGLGVGLTIDENGKAIFQEGHQSTEEDGGLKIGPLGKNVNHNRTTDLGSGGRDYDKAAYVHYLRTADAVPAHKAAMRASDEFGDGKAAAKFLNQHDDAVLVPAKELEKIESVRAEKSYLRDMGVEVVPTGGSDVVNVTKETTEQSLYEINMPADDTNADEDESIFGVVQVKVYDFDKVVNVHQNMLSAPGQKLIDFINRRYAEKQAATENFYAAVGTGLHQPVGFMTNGQTGKTTASATAVVPGEITDLYYSLAAEYRADACFAMHDDIESAIRKLELANGPFAFQPGLDVSGSVDWDTLLRKPVITSKHTENTITDGEKIVAFFSGSAMKIAEDGQLAIVRLPMDKKRQIPILSYYRQGIGVIIPEAIQILVVKAA